MSLRTEILNFDDALTNYDNLPVGVDIAHVHFSLSLASIITHFNTEIKSYLDDLDKGECKEVFGVDFKRMTKKEYWQKSGGLKRDMIAMKGKTLKDFGIDYKYNGEEYNSLSEIFQKVEDGINEMIMHLKEAKKKTMNAPIALFGNFYHKLESHQDFEPVITSYQEWKMREGKLTFERLKEMQTKVVADFLIKGILRYLPVPTKRELSQVKLDLVNDYLPYDYELPPSFKEQCALFRRIISWEDDILKIDYDIYGKYLFRYYYQLTPEERQALFVFDKTLQLIHQDMMKVKPEMAKKSNDSASDGTNYFAISKNLKVLLEKDQLHQMFADKKYNDQWSNKFIDDLMKSECRDSIAKEWKKADKRMMLKCAIMGILKDAGVLKGSYRAIAQQLSDESEQTETFAKYMGYGKKLPCYDWILDYVRL